MPNTNDQMFISKAFIGKRGGSTKTGPKASKSVLPKRLTKCNFGSRLEKRCKLPFQAVTRMIERWRAYSLIEHTFADQQFIETGRSMSVRRGITNKDLSMQEWPSKRWTFRQIHHCRPGRWVIHFPRIEPGQSIRFADYSSRSQNSLKVLGSYWNG